MSEFHHDRVSILGKTSAGAHHSCAVDAAGHLQIDVLTAPSTAVTGAVTATLSTADRGVLDDI